MVLIWARRVIRPLRARFNACARRHSSGVLSPLLLLQGEHAATRLSAVVKPPRL